MRKYDKSIDRSRRYDEVMKQILAKIAWNYMEHQSWVLFGMKSKRLEKFRYCKTSGGLKAWFVSSFVVQIS